MKRQVMMALTMLSLIVALAVTSAKAQSRSHFMRINIPFEFIIRGETLPPGAYTVKRASQINLKRCCLAAQMAVRVCSS